MPLDSQLIQKARKEKDFAVREHRQNKNRLKQGLYQREPRLRVLEDAIRGIFLAALSRLSPEAVSQAARESLALRRERDELLASMGVSLEEFEDSPLCPYCEDTGYLEGQMCRCLAERAHRLQIKELSSLLDLNGQSFDSFDIALFSEEYDAANDGTPRQNMEVIYEGCLKFCRCFGKGSDNLLFSGPPGTGKTFLSACIAGEISRKGFSVVYDTAVHQLSLMESLHFGRGSEDIERAARRLRACDLLIIDDLGMEFLSPFSASALMDLVNQRLIEGKKMLISTNLTPQELAGRYSGALASRLEGEFLWLTFFGQDLRKARNG